MNQYAVPFSFQPDTSQEVYDHVLSKVEQLAAAGADVTWLQGELLPGLQWAAGMRVVALPLHGGKHVAISGWKRLDSLLAVWKARNISDLTGWCFQPASCDTNSDRRLLVIDVDRPDFEALNPLADSASVLAMVRSGSYSPEQRYKQHLYSFCNTEADVLGVRGADWLCDKQVVVGPGSKHHSGNLYQSTGVEPDVFWQWAESHSAMEVPGLPSRSGVSHQVSGPHEGRDTYLTSKLYGFCSSKVRTNVLLVESERFDDPDLCLERYFPVLVDLMRQEMNRWPTVDWYEGDHMDKWSGGGLDVRVAIAWGKAWLDEENWKVKSQTFAATTPQKSAVDGLLDIHWEEVKEDRNGNPVATQRQQKIGSLVKQGMVDSIVAVSVYSNPQVDEVLSQRVRLLDSFNRELAFTVDGAMRVHPNTLIPEMYGIMSMSKVAPRLYLDFADREVAGIPTGFWAVAGLAQSIRANIPENIEWLFLFNTGDVFTNLGWWTEGVTVIPLRSTDLASEHLQSIKLFQVDSEISNRLLVQQTACQVLEFHFPEFTARMAGYMTLVPLRGWFKDYLQLDIPHLAVLGSSQAGKSKFASLALREMVGALTKLDTTKAALEVALGVSRAGAFVNDDNDALMASLSQIYRSSISGGELSNTQRVTHVLSGFVNISQSNQMVENDFAAARRTCVIVVPDGVTKMPSRLGLSVQMNDWNALDLAATPGRMSRFWVEMLLEVVGRIDVKAARATLISSDTNDSNAAMVEMGLRIYLAAALDYDGDPLDPQWVPELSTESAGGYPVEPWHPLSFLKEETVYQGLVYQLVGYWHEHYRAAIFNQWRWSESYLDRLNKVPWSADTYYKSFDQALGKLQIPVCLVGGRLSMKPKDASDFLRRKLKADGKRFEGASDRELQTSLKQLGASSQKLGTSRWWRLSELETRRLFESLNIADLWSDPDWVPDSPEDDASLKFS